MIDERMRRSRSRSLALPAAALVFASGHVSAQEPARRRGAGSSRVDHRHGLANRHPRRRCFEPRDHG